MENIKCIAVDDELPSLRLIEAYINQSKGIKLCATFRNPREATSWLQQNSCDILFLDIQMPQQNGMEMFQNLKQKPIVIFITAYSEFAANAFDLNAIDYLLKPFSYERFSKAIEKASYYLKIDLHKKSELINTKSDDDFLNIKSDGKLIKVFFSEIIYIEGFQEYIKIYTEKEKYVTYERMKNMEMLLPNDSFMRVHRSYIVSLKKIKAVSGNYVEIDSYQIPISRELKEDLIKRVF